MKKNLFVELFTTFISFGLIYLTGKHLFFDLPIKSILGEAIFVSAFTTIGIVFALRWFLSPLQKLIKKLFH